jgi:periplasmic divalent cation tolerance protein
VADEIVALITASSEAEAVKISTALIEEHLAACVNIVPEIRSLFTWKEKTQDENETLLIVKSRQPLLDRLITRVKSLHSYTVPEIIALPVIGGSGDYLAWLKETTKG